MERTLGAVFDEEVVSAAAAERGLDAAAVRRGLDAVQDAAERAVSVDGLVYEWRRAFRFDPLVERTPEAYYLRVERRVWDHFADRCGFDDATRAAVTTVHAVTAERRPDVAGRDDERRPDDEPSDHRPLVLVRR
ncbi:hypothetical protein [Halomarina ordinaria]|uniref:DUF8048 domain-containing protein n=1 Tax=Halomarina ordinaria TaxID=3033939 RepID=A0ABD5U5S6_9EURY|nr:hypothetical protein [Halomarina sp. PSRA2]